MEDPTELVEQEQDFDILLVGEPINTKHEDDVVIGTSKVVELESTDLEEVVGGLGDSSTSDIIISKKTGCLIVKPTLSKLKDHSLLYPLIDIIIREFTGTSKKELEDFIRLNRRKRVAKVRRLYLNFDFDNADMLYAYKIQCENGVYEYDSKLEDFLQSSSFRSGSGVIVNTIFTSAFPGVDKDGNPVEFSCEYKCRFCPMEPGQPKSYLKLEPGVARANKCGFDCVKQFRDRCKIYIINGHPICKFEVLVLGGTWSSYKKDYQEEFIRDMYYAANTLFDENFDTAPRARMTLEEEMKINVTARGGIIGLTLETRPDRITPSELQSFRRYGVTRVQLGAQHFDDRILERVDRRCKHIHLIKAVKLLLDSGYKFDIHLMPDLPMPLKKGVDIKKEFFEIDDIDFTVDMAELDLWMFKQLISDSRVRPDQIKVYPCMVVPWTNIEHDYKTGVHKPYGEGETQKKLFDLIIWLMENIPEWIRTNRIIRDIPPKDYVIGGVDVSNMRQLIDDDLRKRNSKSKCIRFREVKKQDIDYRTAVLRQVTYEASNGEEHFLSYVTPDEEMTIFGFLRLRLSAMAGKTLVAGTEVEVFPELIGCALIRELHVYGTVVPVTKFGDKKDVKQSQHVGFGTRLLRRALAFAKERGYKKIAVISGNGVKIYYQKFGFAEEGVFMTRSLEDYVIPDSNETTEIIKYVNGVIVPE